MDGRRHGMVIIGQGSSKKTLGANKKDIVRKHVNPSSINKKVSQLVKLPLFETVNCSYLIERNVVLLRVSIHGPHSAFHT